MSNEELCCLSDADQALLARLEALHEKPWNKKVETFEIFFKRFADEAVDVFAQLSLECRQCLLHAVHTYCRSAVGGAYTVNIREVAKAAKRGYLTDAIPKKDTGFELYRVAVLHVMPSMNQRMLQRRKAA